MSLMRWAGMAAPLVYLAAVLAGGAVTPGYDHFVLPISALMAGYGGPWWLYALLLAYNIALFAFGLSLPMRITRLALLVSAVTGIGMLIFPMDPVGAEMTIGGIIHLVLAGLASLASLAAIAGGAGFFHHRRESRPAHIAWLALAIVFITGLGAAIGTAQGWPIAGLLERLTIGTFLLWVGWLASRPPGLTARS